MEGIEEFWDKLPTWLKIGIPIAAVAAIIFIWAPWKKKSANGSSGLQVLPSGLNSTTPYVTPITNTSSPVSNTSSPVSNTSSPVSNTSSPVSNTSSPVSNTSSPVSNTTPPAKVPISSQTQPAIVAKSSSEWTGLVVNNIASARERLNALTGNQPVSLPGVSPGEVGYLGEVVRGQAGQAASGVLPNGVVVLNRNAPFADQLRLLGSHAPVSIPGLSSAQVAYLQNLARRGKLKGIGANGKAIVG